MKGRDKWLKELATYAGGGEATCPECGGHEFKHAYVRSGGEVGYGAFWCENCQKALWLSRAILPTGHTKDAIGGEVIPALPDELKFI